MRPGSRSRGTNPALKSANSGATLHLGGATEAEKTLFLGWKQYWVSLNRIDLADPVWPVEPENRSVESNVRSS
ncbi:tail fiber assembly protein [Burkholderia anthina]|uniref:tail fiber assembly protein n=1 Tax=Burkholderia anthina TaxID=179879 RepID=UPI00397734AA